MLKRKNAVEDIAVDCLAHEADEGTQPNLSKHSASKVPDVERDQGSDSTTSEPSPTEATRGPKRRTKDEGGSLIFGGLHQTTAHPRRPRPTTVEKQNGSRVRRRGCVSIQDQAHRSDMASGRSDPGSPTKVGTMKRPRSPTWCPACRTAMTGDPKESTSLLSQTRSASQVGERVARDTFSRSDVLKRFKVLDPPWKY
jgi:hypothetical protein